MTTSELAKHDGRDGRPAYVAVNDTIYDVSASPHWQNGQHAEAHQAGQDLTEALKVAPHVRAVIERFPVVGRLEVSAEKEPGKKLPAPLIIGAVVALLILLALLL